jgi:hypothetical protein
MQDTEVIPWDGKTIQDVWISVGTNPEIKVDDRQDDVVDEEIDLEREDWVGSIEEEGPPASARRSAAR